MLEGSEQEAIVQMMDTKYSAAAHRTAAVVIGALLLMGCGSNDAQDDNEPTAPPPMVEPEPAEDAAASTEDIPIAELADATWVEETAAEHAIPQRAMAAYAGAALRIAETRPECNLGWNTLAGVGSVETAHASIDESGLNAQGVAEPAIIGPVLDGSEGVMEVEDTDEGEYDDDKQWDRAVGPMQFLPETWETHAVDGNFDGEIDPQQIDDAVLTAGVYLCENAEDLTDDDEWVQAVTTYNQSLEYARDVAGIAESYAGDTADE
ncbi:MAG: lytic murein transglycosylase [Yaniella sp.]|nr:lytic murein transglycosylase [Yaniella sp.]